MKLVELESAVRQHNGEFLCERIHNKEETKIVQFAHAVTPPTETVDLPAVGRLRDFYDTFGSVVFYCDEKSGSAARYIAPPLIWARLNEGYSAWIEDLSEDECTEILPDWAKSCLVIGEAPRTGNYVLVATQGSMAGYVFEFDHDGFEFIERATDVVEYVYKLLNLDNRLLRNFASHMRFIEGDHRVQWWIRQYSDNQGRVLTTEK